jgi:RNA polymerase sigma-70 factor, ECF subfamily
MSAPAEVPADELLIKAILSGDDDSFAELVRRHKRKVFNTVARFVRHSDELDDICQEVFIKVYQNLRKYRADAPFEHWLSKITVNACYDALRKQRRKGEEVPLEDVAVSLTESETEESRSDEAWKILKPALAKLSPEEQLVITLLNLQEKSVREISGLTGWSESKVKVRAYRARKELKRILEDIYGNRSE